MTRTLNTLSVVIIISALMMAFYTYTENRPYRMTRTLPELHHEEVDEIIMDYSFDGCNGCDFDGDLKTVVLWFNDVKELKTDVGTTSDCRMTIRLRDGREIYIWNMYSHDMVTVGFKQGNDYYQTNVYSSDLAEYFHDFRERKVAQTEQGAWLY